MPILVRRPTAVICDPNNPNIYPVGGVCEAYTREILLQFEASQFAPGNATVKVGRTVT